MGNTEQPDGDSLSGKYYIVTGANDGIGFEAAKLLCRRGAHVTLGCRNLEKMNTAISSIKSELPGSDPEGLLLDLADLSSVENFASTYIAKNIPLHGLILNAAVLMPPYELTKDGYELTLQVNHLAHVYLTLLLFELLKQCAPSRVVVVASESWKMSHIRDTKSINLDILSPSADAYSPFYAYGNSKYCNILFANELNRLYSSCGVSAHSLHPGNLVQTSLTRNSTWIRLLSYIYWPLSPSPSQAADLEVFVATSGEPLRNNQSGRYWLKGIFGRYSSVIGTEDMGKALWHLSLKCLKEARNFSFPTNE